MAENKITWLTVGGGMLTTDGNIITYTDNNGVIHTIKSDTSNVLVGSIQAFCGSVLPDGYLWCNGQQFNPKVYPELYELLGNSNVVPDTRGMFLRGLDASGNIDNVVGGRTLLSFEEGSYIVGDRESYTRTYTHMATIKGDSSTWGETTNYNGGSLSSINWDVPKDITAMPPSAWGGGNQEYSGITPAPDGTYTYTQFSGVHGITRPKNIAINYIICAA